IRVHRAEQRRSALLRGCPPADDGTADPERSVPAAPLLPALPRTPAICGATVATPAALPPAPCAANWPRGAALADPRNGPARCDTSGTDIRRWPPLAGAAAHLTPPTPSSD